MKIWREPKLSCPNCGANKWEMTSQSEMYIGDRQAYFQASRGVLVQFVCAAPNCGFVVLFAAENDAP